MSKKSEEAEQTFYYIHITDAERNRIRLGPLTSDSPDELVTQLHAQVTDVGVEKMLTEQGLWSGLTVELKGDDDTKILLAEIEYESITVPSTPKIGDGTEESAGDAAE